MVIPQPRVFADPTAASAKKDTTTRRATTSAATTAGETRKNDAPSLSCASQKTTPHLHTHPRRDDIVWPVVWLTAALVLYACVLMNTPVGVDMKHCAAQCPPVVASGEGNATGACLTPCGMYVEHHPCNARCVSLRQVLPCLQRCLRRGQKQARAVMDPLTGALHFTMRAVSPPQRAKSVSEALYVRTADDLIRRAQSIMGTVIVLRDNTAVLEHIHIVRDAPVP